MDKALSYIRKVGNKWVVFSHDGKKLGEYGSKKEAVKRLRQIEYFKNKTQSFKQTLADAIIEVYNIK